MKLQMKGEEQCLHFTFSQSYLSEQVNIPHPERLLNTGMNKGADQWQGHHVQWRIGFVAGQHNETLHQTVLLEVAGPKVVSNSDPYSSLPGSFDL